MVIADVFDAGPMRSSGNKWLPGGVMQKELAPCLR
jgi:hypothetical protein